MKKIFILPLFLFSIFVSTNCFAGDPADVKLYTTEDSSFEDVSEFTKEAIVGKGLKIEHKGFIGKMLERTKGATGGKAVYKNAEYYTFCSAKLTNEAVTANPANIRFCPYVVFLYELAKSPGKVYVGYRVPDLSKLDDKSKKAVGNILKLLDDVAKKAVE